MKPSHQDIERGVFATRLSRRPNPIGLSIVEMIGREGNTLLLDGLEILDSSPMLDIKPYAVRFNGIDKYRNGWQDDVEDSTARLRGKRCYRGQK